MGWDGPGGEPAIDPVTPRLHGETTKAFHAFLIYRDLREQRSLALARQRCGIHAEGKCIRLLEYWSSKWNWLDRCRDFDNHEEAVREKARDRVAAQQAAKWERRRLRALENAYEDAELLRKTALAMLRVPVVAESTGEDGRVELEPRGRWAMRDAATFLKVANEIQAGVLGATAPDPATMSDEELRAVADVGLDVDQAGDLEPSRDV